VNYFVSVHCIYFHSLEKAINIAHGDLVDDFLNLKLLEVSIYNPFCECSTPSNEMNKLQYIYPIPVPPKITPIIAPDHQTHFHNDIEETSAPSAQPALELPAAAAEEAKSATPDDPERPQPPQAQAPDKTAT
jgi:hypothetical protein